MLRTKLLLSLILLAPQVGSVPAKTSEAAVPPGSDPSYAANSQLKFPAHYREWIYLTSGLDMSYDREPSASSHSIFDNVFVNPSSYQAFLRTGTWPEGTVMILEQREAAGPSSINTKGKTQVTDVMGLLAHVKDATHGGWSFYSFNNQVSAKRIDNRQDCYTCHQQHAAVDNTFVQFYPTLLQLAKDKGTLSKQYLTEVAPAAKAAY